ncbi:GNAT family N-acetyltransferase [Devosia aquimaris]|uniref:GNAT family N-acetyltransferase n=1 Tax=Devosia aquimaris TaxID=2866214 RepID=UPI001CD15D40|nr:GNAT family N-acetyltransferase [Devosia sp. CJK-A8-3]
MDWLPFWMVEGRDAVFVVSTAAPDLPEVLALDLLCLRAADGEALDVGQHRQRLEQALAQSQWVVVRRDWVLVAYGYLWPLEDGSWFVGGLLVHPQYRTAPTIERLSLGLAELIEQHAIGAIKSHVLHTNQASLRLHRRLGFVVEKSNELAVALIGEGATVRSRLGLGG